MKAILTYHSIDDSGSVISVTRAQLEQHLDWLASGRVRVVPLRHLAGFRSDVDAVAITFDDGFANFATIAAPLLSERGLSATVFVCPGYVGRMNAWESERSDAGIPPLPLMGWDEIRALSRAGFDIGGHGLSHKSLRGLSAAALATEVAGCAAEIEERLQNRAQTFAYPYGHFDRAAVEAVSQSFAVACTTNFRTLRDTDSPHELPRLDMFYFRRGRILERWAAAPFRAYLSLVQTGRAMRAAFQGSKRPVAGG